MGGGEAVKLQHDVNVIGHHQHLDLAAQAAQRQRATASGSRHSHSWPMRLVRTAPIDRAARIIDSRCQREGARFSISVCLAQHQRASSEVETSDAALAQKARWL
jgi:hypothetical protein